MDLNVFESYAFQSITLHNHIIYPPFNASALFVSYFGKVRKKLIEFVFVGMGATVLSLGSAINLNVLTNY